ncbi:MAG: alpha-L-fucosidase, partial [Burkholderiales bacterium]|nr:alpha-L-fucosidase [Anaerolineae bacterium]
NVGPMADGTIPDLQRERLLGLGAWLKVNGEAIFGTRPWVTAEGSSEDIPVRFTQKDGSLYAALLDTPHTAEITLNGLRADDATTVHLLGHAEALAWSQQGDNLTVTLPAGMSDAPAHALKITPIPQHLSQS